MLLVTCIAVYLSDDISFIISFDYFLGNDFMYVIIYDVDSFYQYWLPIRGLSRMKRIQYIYTRQLVKLKYSNRQYFAYE